MKWRTQAISLPSIASIRLFSVPAFRDRIGSFRLVQARLGGRESGYAQAIRIVRFRIFFQ